MEINLNGEWKMRNASDSVNYLCSVPCSVYKTLAECGVIEDPYYRENEYKYTSVSDDDYIFETVFDCDEAFIRLKKQFVVFEGIDTLSEVRLNGKLLGKTDNMHRRWEFDVKGLLKDRDNILDVRIFSPTKYIEKMNQQRPLWGVSSTMEGYTHIRKAHCMFGWDWGPKLPDLGIFRDVKLVGYKCGRILDVYYSQEHKNGSVYLNCLVHSEHSGCDAAFLEVYSPEGQLVCSENIDFHDDGKYHEMICRIQEPKLWWVRGFGEQPLYKCVVKLVKKGDIVDENVTRIGLRTLTISRNQDQWGEEFCFINNGVKIFAMGANYIPEDQIISRRSKEKTIKLLEQCKKANFNTIRVWGGGYYPDDYFYDYCDENGIIVWQDFMFACSAYLLTDEFESTVREEIKDNVIRFRNHASLGLFCGNNEIESAWEYWGLPEDEQSKADYLRQFEEIIPDIVSELSPQTFYWPSSPSSGGGFMDASSNHAGDMHYWAVWHSLKPIEDFNNYYYRFCSEYGFESLPSIKTCKAFADPAKGDFNLTSPVMEAHQKCEQGNEKIMFYLAQMVRYPYSFEELIYSSQLVQADCIRSEVEHMRRNRGRCMGSLYWQLNDSNPVISWSSVDYFGRLKPLHYCAEKFYAPILVSVDASDLSSVKFNVSNESKLNSMVMVTWNVRSNANEILASNKKQDYVPMQFAKDILTENMTKYFSTENEKRTRYIEYYVEVDGEVVSKGTTLLVRPKMFEFLPPKLKTSISETPVEYVITLTSGNFTKSVWLDLKEGDCRFSENWFDIHGGESISVTVKKSEMSEYMNLETFKNRLVVQAYNLW